MKRILSLILLAMFILSVGEVSASQVNLNFKYVKMHFYSNNASVEMVINHTDSITIQFKRIYAGELFGKGMFPDSWSGDIGSMSVTKEMGKSKDMGNYIHINMKTTVTLRSMTGFRQNYPAEINIDFYLATHPYPKNGMKVDNHTLRYDIRINTNCPANFIMIQEELKSNNEMNAFMLQDHQWKKMKETYSRLPLNVTSKFGEIGLGQESANYYFFWNTMSVNSLFYTYAEGNLNLFFAYNNSGTVVDDPYIRTPVPIYTVSEEISHAVNYFMEHAFSVVIGLVAAVGLVAVPLLKRRRL